MTKIALRKEMLARRGMLSSPDRAQKSAAAKARLFQLEEFRCAASILFFVGFGSEVETLPMIEDALRQSKQIIVPKVEKGNPNLELRCLTEPAVQLSPGAMGILEPGDDCPLVTLQEIDLIIVPAVAWDEMGFRLGYGGGFYDRLLAGAGVIPKVGLGFECQIVAAVPRSAHDLPVDALVTEERLLHFPEPQP